ncbi:FadR/GntR family transcriptional regulator [Brevibacterium album]|uniref:FadR/GntR family transcriptional regulator n=1 Tax=Brevibacterium album TaxID=417948 RepID=UPI000414823D|nr:FCD domain-containing protein [Brevibacterium album]
MPTTLAAAVAAALRERIVTGALTPGERLPSENDLAREHAVSRTVVREAIGRLRAEGLVRSARGSGTYVLAVPHSAAYDPGRPAACDDGTDAGTGRPPSAAAAALPTRPDPAALLEFRLALEPHAAALAAERRTTADLAALEAAATAVETAGAHASDSLEADYRLHRTLAEASGNPYIAGALMGLGPAMIGMPASRIVGDGEHARTVHEEHRAIIGAVRDRDARAAAAAMTWHLTRSRRELG